MGEVIYLPNNKNNDDLPVGNYPSLTSEEVRRLETIRDNTAPGAQGSPVSLVPSQGPGKNWKSRLPD